MAGVHHADDMVYLHQTLWCHYTRVDFCCDVTIQTYPDALECYKL